MRNYLQLMEHVLNHGTKKIDRTGVGTISVFGAQMRFNLEEGFPLLTTKKLHLRSIIHELLWFLKGETNIKYLKENNVRIWDEWADKNGNLGPVYGHQWRSWEANNGIKIDQIKDLISNIKKSRFTSINCKCMECGRFIKNGSSTLSFFFSILCS